jgi:hypothetical protein
MYVSRLKSGFNKSANPPIGLHVIQKIIPLGALLLNLLFCKCSPTRSLASKFATHIRYNFMSRKCKIRDQGCCSFLLPSRRFTGLMSWLTVMG